jgi:hypothetical protein
MKQQIYLDCDGVLADFDKKATEVLGMPPREYENIHGEASFWNTLYEYPNYFAELDPMEDAHELVEAVRYLDPIILTGHPRGYWAVPQKLAWRDKHFKDIPMITCRSVDKRKFCRPGDVLIDDWHKYQDHWIGARGFFILHTSAKDSIKQLKELDIL